MDETRKISNEIIKFLNDNAVFWGGDKFVRVNEIAEGIDVEFEIVDMALEYLKAKDFVRTDEIGSNPCIFVTKLGINYYERIDQERLGKEQIMIEEHPEKKRNVFVIHGRNDKAKDAMFQFLSSLDLHPIEWEEAVAMTGSASPYNHEIVTTAFENSEAVLVLFTPDEIVQLHPTYHKPNDLEEEKKQSLQARPNVYYEFGLAMGRDENWVLIVEIGKIRPFSDNAGRNIIRFDGSLKKRQVIADRLKSMGCDVKTEGKEIWHNAGDFDAVLQEIETLYEFREEVETKGDKGIDIPEEAEKILVEIFKEGDKRVTLNDIKRKMGFNEGMFEYYLDQLGKEGLIDKWKGPFNINKGYIYFISITTKGRDYTIENGLMD